jgi:hypothetical protein
MAAPRVATCIFCDDIRQEVGGKVSIMGVYGADMIFPQAPPVSVLKWGIAVWLIVDVDDIPQKLTITVLTPPGKTEIARVEMDGSLNVGQAVAEDITKYNVRAVFNLSPVTFMEDGIVEVMVETELGVIRAGRLLVRFQPPEAAALAVNPSATGAGLPPSQSQPDVPEPSSPPEPSRPARPIRQRRS